MLSFTLSTTQILSKDSVTVAVDAVVYYRISNATIAVSNVEDYGRSTRLLAATTLRNVLGTKNLSEILCERETISHTMQANLDEGKCTESNYFLLNFTLTTYHDLQPVKRGFTGQLVSNVYCRLAVHKKVPLDQ